MAVPGTYGLPNLAAHPANPASGYVIYFFNNQLFSLGVTPAVPVAYAVTEESIQDTVGALLQGGFGITTNYDDAGNALTISVNTSTFLMTGISFANDNAVLDTDNILVAIGKLQAQLNALPAPNVFGTEAQDFSSTAQVNFSGAIGQRRQYTTASVPAGRYRVAVLIQTEPSATGANDFWELRVDGNNVGLLFENEAKDTGGDIRNLIYIYGYYQHASNGTFNIQIWGGNEGGTTELNGDIVEIWRVS